VIAAIRHRQQDAQSSNQYPQRPLVGSVVVQF
jgi:hypothetical protein